MSMQQAEQAENQRGLRPPTKMLVDLKIEGSTTEQWLQVPAVIAYCDVQSDQGVDCAIECNDYLVRDMLASIAGECILHHSETKRLQHPHFYLNIPRQAVVFPVEKNRDVPCFSFAAGDFYGVRLKKDWLWTRDRYATTLGWHISRLVKRRETHGRSMRTGGVFLAMNFLNETPKAQASALLWKDILRWLDSAGEAITTPRRFLCGDAKPHAALYAHLPKDETILDWALAMVNCRLYIGPDCLLSHLAYSMRIPSIVLSEQPRKSYLDRHDTGKYADIFHQYCYETSEWSLDYVTARYCELERILTTDY